MTDRSETKAWHFAEAFEKALAIVNGRGGAPLTENDLVKLINEHKRLAGEIQRENRVIAQIVDLATEEAKRNAKRELRRQRREAET